MTVQLTRMRVGALVLLVLVPALLAGPGLAEADAGVAQQVREVAQATPGSVEQSPTGGAPGEEQSAPGPSPGLVVVGVFLAIVALAGAIARYRSL